MKVAFVNTVYAPNEIGGAERTVRTLAEALVKHGHQAVVISLAPDGQRSTGDVNGVRVHYLPLLNLFWPHTGPRRSAWKRLGWHAIDAFNLPMALQVAKLLGEEHPDVVQMGNLQGFSVASWLAAAWAGVPLVQMLHDYYLGCANASMFRNGKNCTKQCSSCRVLSFPRRTLSGAPHTVISLSRRTLTLLESRDLFQGVKRKEILHGACNMQPQPSARRDKSAGEPIVLGYLGRIEQTKGIEVLLRAAALLPNKVKVLLGGTGAAAYVSELRSQHAAPNVEFLGFVSPAAFFAQIDVLVVPSVWEEPLGRVIYEAYHHGVPAIVARSGGMPEIVDAGRSGFVFRSEDPDDLAAILAAEIARGWPGARFSAACLAKSREFSIDVVFERYLDIWRTAASSRTANAAAARRPRIGYWPIDPATNTYTERMHAILATLGDVSPFPPRVRLFGEHGVFPLRRDVDVAMINWIENKLVDEHGNPSPKNLLKLLAQTLLFRTKARRLVLVRHNRYPHATQKRYARLVRRLIDLYERMYDQTLTHSSAEVTRSRAYCPHPLYIAAPGAAAALPAQLVLPPGYFVAFGRIERYKRLELLIEDFPRNRRLLIAGATEDGDYVQELRRLRAPNVVIAPGFVPDPLAREVVARAAAVILGHAEDHMIVSGSFFFALSFGKPVLALETPFIRWAQRQLGESAVISAPDLRSLREKIEAFDVPCATEAAPSEHARAAFGDESVRRHLERVLFPVPP